MDFRGGCCIARYSGGACDMSKVDQIMLRFRPIAPKPVTSGSDPSPHGISGEIGSRAGLRKRKHSKVKTSRSVRGEGCSGAKRCSSERRDEKKVGSANDGERAAEKVTLPLLSETPESPASVSASSLAEREQSTTPLWLNLGGYQMASKSTDLGFVTTTRTERMVVSCVTVEGITDSWIECDEYGLGRCADEQKMMNLERDACPGFISDGAGRITWTNGAYRDLVVGSKEGQSHNRRTMMIMWLVMRERPIPAYPAFACRVRLQYTCRNQERVSMTLPCDVWRMSDGGFAWRLDTDAALCLGR